MFTLEMYHECIKLTQIMTQTPSHFTIKDWSEDDRPREKLLQKGPQSLSNAELLAILIGSGSKKESAVHLMQRLLASIEHKIHHLHAKSLTHLTEWKGIGPAKAVKIKAALELAKRIREEAPADRYTLNNSQEVYQLFLPSLSFLSHEEFWVGFLNHKNQVILHTCMSKGGITSTTVDLRLIYKKALELGATGLVLAHNHPSGNLMPSSADKQLTQRFVESAKTLDIRVLDHLIISEKGYFSFADKNLL